MRFYGDIQRVDAADRMVWGYACTTERASDGLVVTLDAMRDALGPFMKFANIREMHQPVAAGTVREAKVDDYGLYAGSHIVDDTAWKKVEAGVYRAYSIGAKITARDPDDDTIVTGLNILEISLVDRPADPGAVFDVWRAEGVESEEDEPLTETTENAVADDEAAAIARAAAAMKDGSHPIETPADLVDALAAYGSSPKAALRRHIIKRAKAIDAAADLPEGWVDVPVDTAAADVLDRAEDAAASLAASLEALTPAAEEIARVHPVEIKRGLYTVGRLGEILASLSYLLWDTDFEAEMEGDGSPVPAQFRDALTALAAVYKAMSDEEIAEFVAANQPAETVAVEMIENVETGADLERAAAIAAADDMQRKVDGFEAENKVLVATVTSLAEQMERMSAKIEALGQMPAPAKTVARVVDKAEDSSADTAPAAATLADVQRILDAMPPEERALALTRAALARPLPVHN